MAQDVNTNKHFDFEERQRLTNWLTWALILGTLAIIVAVLICRLLTDSKVGDESTPNGLLIGFIFIYYGPAIALMFYARLTVRIDKDAVYYGWNIPTKELNKISWTDVQSCEVTKYTFVGYGYRLTKKYGIVYNTKGNKGLLITKKSGEKVLLGSLKTDELTDTLKKLGVPHSL